EEDNVRDAIAAAIERRRRKQDEMARTPSKSGQQRRRRSSVGFQVRNGKEGLECAMEYRERIGGIGSPQDMKAWREMFEESDTKADESEDPLKTEVPN
ncbi:hypothetical protein HKX48_005754, partial [Thoreauomyces humboldtii]